MDDFSNLSDEQLDAAYAAAARAGQSQTATKFGLVIIDRLNSFQSIFSGILGKNRFPEFSRLSTAGFSNTSIRADIANSAANVADNVAGSLKWGSGVIGLLAVAFIIYKVTSK